jgi:hypothetical protein
VTLSNIRIADENEEREAGMVSRFFPHSPYEATMLNECALQSPDIKSWFRWVGDSKQIPTMFAVTTEQIYGVETFLCLFLN